jgi:acyl dehydratase
MHFEDLVIGARQRLGTYLFTTEAIKRFAVPYDPQPFHIDEARAARSPYGGLIASGWHVAAIWMKLNVAAQLREQEAARDAGLDPAERGPSPGFRNMVWAQPVRPGDELTFWTEISGKADSRSRPDWGVVSTRNEAFDQRDRRVFAFDGAVFWRRRAAS